MDYPAIIEQSQTRLLRLDANIGEPDMGSLNQGNWFEGLYKVLASFPIKNAPQGRLGCEVPQKITLGNIDMRKSRTGGYLLQLGARNASVNLKCFDSDFTNIHYFPNIPNNPPVEFPQIEKYLGVKAPWDVNFEATLRCALKGFLHLENARPSLISMSGNYLQSSKLGDGILPKLQLRIKESNGGF